MKNIPNEINRLQLIQNKVFSNRSKSKCKIQLDIGDDCFAFSPQQKIQVIAQDMMVEGIHFDLNYFKASDLGWKSLAVNLSDLAAKGAQAFCCQVSLAIPSHINDEWLLSFYDGMMELCEEHNIIIAGGDLTASRSDIVIDVSVYGYAEKVVPRKGIQHNDILLCSGPLGHSHKGLSELQKNFKASSKEAKKHLRPKPRLDLIDKLQNEFSNIHASIDISDGLVSECLNLIRHTTLGVELLTSEASSLWGGEDYEILIAVPREAVHHFPDWIKIGNVTDNGAIFSLDLDGKKHELSVYRGWSHF